MMKMLWDSSKVRSIDLQDVFHANGKRFLCGLLQWDRPIRVLGN